MIVSDSSQKYDKLLTHAHNTLIPHPLPSPKFINHKYSRSLFMKQNHSITRHFSISSLSISSHHSLSPLYRALSPQQVGDYDRLLAHKLGALTTRHARGFDDSAWDAPSDAEKSGSSHRTPLALVLFFFFFNRSSLISRSHSFRFSLFFLVVFKRSRSFFFFDTYNIVISWDVMQIYIIPVFFIIC